MALIYPTLYEHIKNALYVVNISDWYDGDYQAVMEGELSSIMPESTSMTIRTARSIEDIVKIFKAGSTLEIPNEYDILDIKIYMEKYTEEVMDVYTLANNDARAWISDAIPLHKRLTRAANIILKTNPLVARAYEKAHPIERKLSMLANPLSASAPSGPWIQQELYPGIEKLLIEADKRARPLGFGMMENSAPAVSPEKQTLDAQIDFSAGLNLSMDFRR